MTSDIPAHKLPVSLKNDSEKDALIKIGEMTPFGGTVENVKGRIESHGAAAAFSFDEDSGGHDRREHGKSLVRSLADNKDSDSSDDNGGDDYVPDDSELKYSWYEDESEEGEKLEVGKGKKSKASKSSLNVAYREDDAFKPKKKRKIKKRGRITQTKPVDDGSEKIYRQRIR